MDILKIIEEKILENGQKAGYSHIALTEVTAVKPTVGLWWYVKGRVLKLEDTIENCEPGEMVCVSQEHQRVFPFMQKQYATEIPELLDLRFNQIERGRVWFVKKDPFTGKSKFSISCSTNISRNPEAIQAIKNSFGLNGKFVTVEVHSGMYDREIKLK